MSFLENIREVHGYVLIVANLANRIPLTSLRIIRGLVLYKPKNQSHMQPNLEHSYEYSLYVAANVEEGVGLKALHLPALRGKAAQPFQNTVVSSITVTI